ncbi:MAG: SulP family inorganic anion transporter [Pseudomonadota bacterium]
MAAIIFAGDLKPFADLGATMTLLATAATATIGAFTVSYRGTVIAPQDVTAVTLSVATAAIAAALVSASSETIFATVISTILIASVMTGLFLLALGRFRLGGLARYIPYPVIGGFLSATGFLLLFACLAMSTGERVTLFTVPTVLSESPPILWAPALSLAVVFFLVSKFVAHPVAVPAALGLAFVAFYGVLLVTGTSLEEARGLGLLLASPETDATPDLANLAAPLFLMQADYGAILDQAPTLLTVTGLAAVGMMLSASGLEHTTRREYDLNREFMGTGLANLGSGLFGGPPCYHYTGTTTLAYALHVRSRASGGFTAIVCLLLVVAGGSIVGNLPLAVLAGLSGFVGLTLLYDWLIARRSSLPLLDYAVMILIVAVMVGVGFVEGVVTGLLLCVLVFCVLSARQDVVLKRFTSATRQSMVDRAPQEREALATHGQCNAIFELTGHLFFGTANRLHKDIVRVLDTQTIETVVLDFRRVQSVDSSAGYSLQKLANTCALRGTAFVMTDVRAELRGALDLDAVIAMGTVEILDTMEDGMTWAENRLLAHLNLDDRDAPLTPPFVDLLRTAAERFATRRTLVSGEALVRAGEASDGYFVVEEGQLSVTIPAVHGEAFRIRTVGPGALIGEVGHYTKSPRTATVETVGACTILYMGGDALHRMEEEAPDLALSLHKEAARYLATRLTENTLLIERTR